MIWPLGNYPDELVEQATSYREEYLLDPGAFYDEIVSAELETKEVDGARGRVKKIFDSRLVELREI